MVCKVELTGGHWASLSAAAVCTVRYLAWDFPLDLMSLWRTCREKTTLCLLIQLLSLILYMCTFVQLLVWCMVLILSWFKSVVFQFESRTPWNYKYIPCLCIDILGSSVLEGKTKKTFMKQDKRSTWNGKIKDLKVFTVASNEKN